LLDSIYSGITDKSDNLVNSALKRTLNNAHAQQLTCKQNLFIFALLHSVHASSSQIFIPSFKEKQVSVFEKKVK